MKNLLCAFLYLNCTCNAMNNNIDITTQQTPAKDMMQQVIGYTKGSNINYENVKTCLESSLSNPNDDPGYYDLLSEALFRIGFNQLTINSMWDEYGLTDAGRSTLLDRIREKGGNAFIIQFVGIASTYS